VPGHLQEWWHRIFFVVFKVPPPGSYHIFRYKEAYAQILIVPKKVSYEIYPMDKEESDKRANFDKLVTENDKILADRNWTDNNGNSFNDKYKVFSRLFAKGEDLEKYIADKTKKNNI